MTAVPSEFLGRSQSRLQIDGLGLVSAYIFCITVLPANLSFKGGVTLTPGELVGLTMGLWLACAHMTNTLGAAKGRNAVRRAVLLFVISLLLTYGYGSLRYLPPDETKALDRKLVALSAFVAICMFVCDGVRTLERLDSMVKRIVLGASFIAGVAALQFFLELDLTEYLQNIPGMGFAPYHFDALGERSGFRRVAGTTGSPIELGVVCAMVLPLALHCAMRARERFESSWLWWTCCLLLGATIFYSLSRSAILGLVVVSVVLFASWTPRIRLRAVLVGVGFLAALKVLIPGLLTSLFDLFAFFGVDTSVQHRTDDYPVIFAAVSHDILLGRGVGTWYAPKYQTLDNQYLHALVEAGIVGLVAMIGLFASSIRAALRIAHHATDPELRSFSFAVVAALLVPVVGSATFDLLAFSSVAGMTFLLLGVSGALLHITSAQADGPNVFVGPADTASPGDRPTVGGAT